MGFLSKRLRELIKKKEKQRQAVITKTALKDISFKPSSISEADLTQYVNSRIQDLAAQVGGMDNLVIDDFDIKYIDKTLKEDFKTISEFTSHEVENHKWMLEKSTEENEMRADRNRDALTFYMIIIEYTKVKRS